MGQEAVFLCPKMVIALGALVTMVSAMIHSGNSTMQVDRPPVEMTNPAAHTPEGDASSEDFTDSLDEVWMRAEERYGLVRPEPGETVIAVHRQTSQRFALSPDTWDERSLCILRCRLRLYSLILFMGTMTYVPVGKMPHGGYVGCMNPHDLPVNRCWLLPTMCLFRRMTFWRRTCVPMGSLSSFSVTTS